MKRQSRAPTVKEGAGLSIKDEKTKYQNEKRPKQDFLTESRKVITENIEMQDLFSPINQALLCSGSGLIPTSCER